MTNVCLQSHVTLHPDRIKEADVATVTSPIGLWSTVLMFQVWHFGGHHFGFLEPKITLFSQDSGAAWGGWIVYG